MGIRYILIFLLVIPFVSSSVRINEIMYNPGGSDMDHEWIEIYNNGSDVDLTGWKFYEEDINHGLSLKQGNWILENDEYAIIASNDVIFLLDYPGFNGTLFDSSFSLLNSGENLSIKNNSEDFMDSIIYLDLARESYSLEYYNGSWYESTIISGTPGINNSYTDKNTENTCNAYIEILLDKLIFENETIYFTPKAYGTSGYVIQYWIEDLYGDISKSKTETSNSNTKQWTPDIDKEEQSFIIKANITYLDCNDTDFTNNYAESLIAVLKQETFAIQDFTKIEINEFLPDPIGNDDAAMPSGEWVELYNSGSTALDLENLSLKDNYGQEADIFISDSNTIGGTVINSGGYLVVYMNGRYGFLNNEDYEKIYLYNDNYLLDEVSYSGSTEGLSWNKVDNKWVSTLPTPGAQNHGNETGNIINSNLKIEDIYDLGNDNKAKFGQTIRVKLSVYKGNTNKESISVSIENEKGEGISKESRANVEDKFTNYSLTLPVQIIANCKQKFKDGEYFIVTSGLDDTDKEEIEVSGIDSSLCEIIKEYSQKDISKTYSNGSESVLNKELITGNVIYESKSEKQGRYSTYFFCFALIMLIIYLLWKNE